MQKNSIIEACDKVVKGFYEELNALDFVTAENKKTVEWQIIDKLSKIEFVYLKKESMFNAPSVLYARVFPNKNDYLFFMPHEIYMLEGDTDSVKPYIYPYIESPERMESCITELIEQIKLILAKVQDFAIDTQKFETVKEIKNQELYRVFAVKEKDIPKPDDEYFDLFYVNLYILYEATVVLPRIASKESPFIKLATGKPHKAKRIYAKWDKKDKLLSYEKVLYEKLQNGEVDFELYSPECDSISEIFPFANSSAEGSMIFNCALLCYAVLAPLFSGLVMLISSFKAAGTVFFAGTPWYFGLILAVIPAIFGGIALRRKIIPIIYRSKKKQMLQADELLSTKGVTVFAYIFFIIMTVLMLGCSVLVYNECVSFYGDHLNYNKNEGALFAEPTDVLYTDIEKIYKIEGRYNDYGDYIERASYVLCFKDGTSLDLDGYVSVKNTEKKVLPILEEFVDGYITVKSDRELPKN